MPPLVPQRHGGNFNLGKPWLIGDQKNALPLGRDGPRREAAGGHGVTLREPMTIMQLSAST